MPRRQPSPSSSSPSSPSSPSDRKRAANTPEYLKVLEWCLWGTLGIACVMNVQPYREGASRLFGSRFFVFNLAEILQSIPFIGSYALTLLGAFGALAGGYFGKKIKGTVGAVIGAVLGFVMIRDISFGAGLLFWVCLQVPELMLLLLMFNQGFLRKFIQKASSGNREQVSKTDYISVKIAKVAHNRLDTEILVTLLTIGGIAYLVDILFCNFINPPVGDGSINSFFLMFNYIATGQTSLIDWSAVMMNAIILVAVESIVLSVLFVKRLVAFMDD